MTTHRDRYPIRVGVLVWPQQTEWAPMLETARLADGAGLDSLWTWDHMHAIVGDPLQPIFEGWTTLAGWAAETDRIDLGLMVGANTFRNPGLTAKTAVTVDHISEGRLWLGLGGAWFEYEHTAAGVDFGSGFGQRLDWLDESVSAITCVLGGEVVTGEPGGRYAFEALEHHPLPYHTLVTFAVLRDDADEAARVLQERLDANGSERLIDPAIDFLGDEARVAAQWRRYLDSGFTHIVVDLPAPVDRETVERLPRLRELVAAG